MNVFDFPEARSIVVVGDIHGEFNKLVHKCCVRYKVRDALIVVAGDCGFGFERPGYYDYVYERHRRYLSSANCWLVMVRGNHDNPAYFNGPYRIRHERFMTVPDYTVLTACGHVALCVGGAVSVDRMVRKNSPYYRPAEVVEPLERNVYWEDEPPVFDPVQLETLSEAYRIDTVITHTAPMICDRIVKLGLYSFSIDDDRLLADVEEERATMERLRVALLEQGHPLRYWCYGHFHQSWHYEIDGVLYNMLDIMEFVELTEGA
ncbi:MAG: metallophosphoesterase [Bacteroidales bacterium]|nr:metallophosphoesterase [Bacteroidales bacterium]